MCDGRNALMFRDNKLKYPEVALLHSLIGTTLPLPKIFIHKGRTYHQGGMGGMVGTIALNDCEGFITWFAYNGLKENKGIQIPEEEKYIEVTLKIVDGVIKPTKAFYSKF